jgi:hypothetical protein
MMVQRGDHALGVEEKVIARESVQACRRKGAVNTLGVEEKVIAQERSQGARRERGEVDA